MKFWNDWYIFGYVLKKKFFRLIRGGPVTSWSHCNECPNISRWHEVDFEALSYVYYFHEKKITSYVQTGFNPLATGLLTYLVFDRFLFYFSSFFLLITFTLSWLSYLDIFGHFRYNKNVTTFAINYFGILNYLVTWGKQHFE